MLLECMKSRARILDDDSTFLEEMSHFLAGEGFAIAFASVNAEGLLCDVTENDVFFLDIQMPGWQPGDMFRSIARNHRNNAVVLMTGLPSDIAKVVCALAEQSGLRVLGIYFKDGSPDQIAPMVALHQTGCRNAASPAPPAAADIRARVTQLLAEGHLSFTFQPLVNGRTRRFSGAETLLPDTLPGLPGASPLHTAAALKADAPLSYRLHMEAVRQGAEACRAWRAAGLNGTIDVNMPAECLRQPALLHDLRVAIAREGLTPRDMIIELPEDSDLEGGSILNALAALRMDGFGLALDDVGQRESGLMRLASLPVTEIKIDRLLVHAARDWGRAQSVYQHLCSMARSMKITTVAEGIETEEDIRNATLCGVDFFQGFLFGRKQSRHALLAAFSGEGTGYVPVRGAKIVTLS